MACFRMPIVSFVVILAFLCPLRGKWLDFQVILCPVAGITSRSLGYGLLRIFNRVRTLPKMFMLRQMMSCYYSGILILLSMKFNYCEFMTLARPLPFDCQDVHFLFDC